MLPPWVDRGGEAPEESTDWNRNSLDYATCGGVVPELLKMDDEYRQKHLDEHLPARTAEPRLNGKGCKKLPSASSILCIESYCLSVDANHQDICVGGMGKGGKTDLDFGLQVSPVFKGDTVGLVWRACRRVEPSSENTH